MIAENELLRRFVDENAQDAFAELVRGKINLVYTAALRLVGGDAHLAEDVTQGVFVALACQAAKLKHHAVLTGWLYTTTRFVASKMVRGQQRWQRREMEAHAMDTTPEMEQAWLEVRPVIDDAMHELSESERAVLLLRFFENRTLAEVGTATGVTENAARMRVERALEKLRGRLAKRGIKSTAAALGVVLAGQSVGAAPASLAPAVTSVALNCAAASAVAGVGGAAAAIMNFMTTTKLILNTAGALVVFGVGAVIGSQVFQQGNIGQGDKTKNESRMELVRLQEQNGSLKAQLEKQRLATAAFSKSGIPGAGAPESGAGKKKWEFLVELSKQKLLAPQLNFVDSSGVLNPAVASVFDLTPQEQQTLTQSLTTAHDKVAELEKLNATITRTPDGKIVIDVKPFPGEGGAVYDEFMASVGQTLGPERTAAFQTLAADQVEKSMGNFGAGERKLTVSSQPDSKYNRYLATDEMVTPNSKKRLSTQCTSRENLAERVGTIANLLPSDF